MEERRCESTSKLWTVRFSPLGRWGRAGSPPESSRGFHHPPHFASFVCVKKLTRAPLMASRDCVSCPDSFCYICGEVVLKKQQRNISDSVKNVYFACLVLNKIKYSDHAWTICGDLKAISMLLGQGKNTKYPCFLCELDSRDRAKHWTKKVWPKRTSLVL